MARRVKSISTICLIFCSDLPFCFNVCGHEHLSIIPRLVRKEAKTLDLPPLFDWRHLILASNCFSARVWNLMNVGNA